MVNVNDEGLVFYILELKTDRKHVENSKIAMENSCIFFFQKSANPVKVMLSYVIFIFIIKALVCVLATSMPKPTRIVLYCDSGYWKRGVLHFRMLHYLSIFLAFCLYLVHVD